MAATCGYRVFISILKLHSSPTFSKSVDHHSVQLPLLVATGGQKEKHRSKTAKGKKAKTNIFIEPDLA
jgi:hypothetical protein